MDPVEPRDRGPWVGGGPEPVYCCAILRTSCGGYLLEDRPIGARHGAGLWTCFGGRREAGESPLGAVERELCEELGGEVTGLVPRVELWVGGEPMAWFYGREGPVDPRAWTYPEGHRWVVVGADGLDDPRLHPWHRGALLADRDGLRAIRFQGN